MGLLGTYTEKYAAKNAAIDGSVGTQLHRPIDNAACVQEFATLSPLMFVEPFTTEYFSKTTQWVSVSRAAAFAVVHDRIVEPWFATFAGSRWRCRFIEEASLILPDIAAMIKTGINIRKRAAAMELLKFRALPPGFSQGELFEPSMPQARVMYPGGGGIGGHSMEGFFLGVVGLPSWATEMWHNFSLWAGDFLHLDGLTSAQRSALRSYKKQLRYKMPPWAYIPVNVDRWKAGRERRKHEEDVRAKHAMESSGQEHYGTIMVSGRSPDVRTRGTGLVASRIGPMHQRAESDSRDLKRRRGQIWDIVLDSDTPRRSYSTLRKLQEASEGSEASEALQEWEEDVSGQVLAQHEELLVGRASGPGTTQSQPQDTQNTHERAVATSPLAASIEQSSGCTPGSPEASAEVAAGQFENGSRNMLEVLGREVGGLAGCTAAEELEQLEELMDDAYREYVEVQAGLAVSPHRQLHSNGALTGFFSENWFLTYEKRKR